jgi:dephospho-CoA kinase
MLKIGLTGGIGCGKTTVADLFAAKGVPVLDADLIARELVEPGQPLLDAIVARFGVEVLQEGRLDRGRLRQIVFADPAQRRWLEELLHPAVYAALERRLDGLAAPYVLLVIPLLLETGRRDFVDRLLVIDCPVALQKQRVKARDGLDDSTIDRILAAQLPREARLAAADDIIENTAGRAELAEQIDRLHQFYVALTAA